MATKRRLRSAIPRAYPDHRRLLARVYSAAYRQVAKRFAGLPEDLLSQHAQITATLADVAGDVAAEAALGTKDARRAKARLRRQEIVLRRQLLAAEARLMALVPKPVEPTPAELVAAARGGR